MMFIIDHDGDEENEVGGDDGDGDVFDEDCGDDVEKHTVLNFFTW